MAKTQMTPFERVMAAINGKEVDCIPAVGPSTVINYDCMESAQAFFPRAHYEASAIAALAEAGHTTLGFDTIMPYFSAHIEAEALGCQVDWGNVTRVPQVSRCPIKRIEDFAPPVALNQKEPCVSLLKAIRLLKRRHKHTVPIVGKVMGPWSLAHHLYGIENMALDLILDLENLRWLLEQLLEISITFAKAQFEAGADIVTWVDHISTDRFSRKMYEDLLFPMHKSAASKLKHYGPTIISIFGNVSDRLDLLSTTGFSMLNITTHNDIQTALRVVGGNALVIGGVNNPDVLVSGNTVDVHREVLRNIFAGARMIAAETAVPLITPSANLIEMVNSAHRAKPPRPPRA